jgi:uncharacterized membrane protein
MNNKIMPVKRKSYSVKIQMILAIIPFVDLWASYRIMKLRLWLLIMWLGFAVLWTLTDWAIYGDKFWDVNYDIPIFPTGTASLINLILSEAITIIVAVILMRKWTIDWNKKIESEGNMSSNNDERL